MRTVLFDFDGTICRSDTFLSFLGRCYRIAPWRVVLLAPVLPLGALLWSVRPFQPALLSLILWIGTVGLSRKQLAQRIMNFGIHLVRTEPVFVATIERMEQHVAQGDRVVVVTGSYAGWIRPLLAREGIAGVPIVGSRFRGLLGGLVLGRRCIGAAKLGCLRAAAITNWDVAYTDSLRDAPILQNAKERFLINPSDKTMASAQRRLGKVHALEALALRA